MPAPAKPTRRGHNTGAASLRRRWRAGDPMAQYDRLPPELRHWLAAAHLPWSPRSAARAYAAALTASHGDKPSALARLTALESARITSGRQGQSPP